jgi:hypothetical protein
MQTGQAIRNHMKKDDLFLSLSFDSKSTIEETVLDHNDRSTIAVDPSYCRAQASSTMSIPNLFRRAETLPVRAPLLNSYWLTLLEPPSDSWSRAWASMWWSTAATTLLTSQRPRRPQH